MSIRWWIPAGILVFGMTGCGGAHEPTAASEEHAEKEEAHVIVRTEPAKRSAIVEAVEGLGRCEALPDHIAMLTPAVEGHVHELLVMQGDPVKRGQPIIVLDEVVAQADLAEKTATRDGLRASLDLLKSLPRAAERKVNELAVEQGKVAVERANALVESLESLRRGGNLASKTQLFDAQQALLAAQLQQQSAEATLHVMMIGPRSEAIAEAEGRIKTADALVTFSKAHLEYHMIRAPIDGTLDSLTCHPGQTIAIGTQIGEVVNTQHVFASIWLPTRSALSVRVGQPARVRPGDTRGAAPDASVADEEGLEGKIAFVGRVADSQTGNLPIRVLVDNPQGRLILGESLRVSITVSEGKDVLQVPAAAILDLGEGPVLYVVREGKAVPLHPEAGTPHGGWVAIAGTDLKEGEPVIVEGGYNLPEGTPVKLTIAKAVAQSETDR